MLPRPVALVVAFALVSGSATLIVHSVHIRLIWDTKPVAPSSPQTELAPMPRRRPDPAPDRDSPAEREARRRDLLAQQRLDLEAAAPPG